jgi:hypothetical protein
MSEFVPIDPDLDVLPKVVLLVRDDETVRAIAGGRVRATDAAGEVAHPVTGELIPPDARGPGEWVPFVVIARNGGPPDPTVPVETVRLVFRCYGADRRQAAVLRRACVNAIHGIEPVTFPNGLVIYAIHDVTGGDQDTDPDTKQPLETFVAEAVASTQALAV